LHLAFDRLGEHVARERLLIMEAIGIIAATLGVCGRRGELDVACRR
jgi:hypothetical protein